MKLTQKIAGVGAACAAAAFTALPAFAQAAPAAAPVVATVNKGDTAWMMTSTVLVMMMILPGLALFYGGLTRAKNMLATMTQIGAVACLAMLIWVMYGYSLAFGPDVAGGGVLTNFIASFDKAFLKGVTAASQSATFTAGVEIPEYVFICFQMTFAAITIALVLGSVVERIKFAAVMVFAIVWLTITYFPIAHMVWASGGLFFKMGALDFAGGTVVHINAAVAGLVGAYMVGKRIGYGKEAMSPHSLTMTMIGAAMLWFGWFGFNAGSALEANGSAALAFVNTLLATAAAVLSWSFGEWIGKSKPSMLGAASGAVAGLVAITPAAGFVGPMGSIALGILAGLLCLWGVNGLKRMLGMDDTLDVFGVHGVGGILGALLTGVFASPSLGGTGIYDYVANKVADGYSIGGQLWIQFQGVLTTVIWSGVVAFISYKIVDAVVGLRVPEEEEREGLDITSHGETAYED